MLIIGFGVTEVLLSTLSSDETCEVQAVRVPCSARGS